MRNPYKIIHKFKNNNGRIQYMIYIFVGPLVHEDLLKVFKNISNKDFYNTLITLSKSPMRVIFLNLFFSKESNETLILLTPLSNKSFA